MFALEQDVHVLKASFSYTTHHHHLVARSKSIAVSMMRRQEGRSGARYNAE